MNLEAQLARAGRLVNRAMRPLRPFLPPRPAILMYHRVASERFDPWGLAVSPANFASQIDWIGRNCTPMPLVELAERHSNGTLSADAVAITFDDGYACNAEVAAPILERSRIAATVFLPAELIDRQQEYWWDEVERIVFDSARRVLRLDGVEHDLGERQPGDRDWRVGQKPQAPRQHAYHALWSALFGKSPPALDRALETLRAQAGTQSEPRQSHRPMTPEEVRSSQSAIVEFGSHAMTHASLPTLTVADKAREIRGGIERCEALTGRRPRSFAYPYGDHDPETEELVRQSGLACACKANGDFVARASDPMLLPRLHVQDWTGAQLARALGRA